MLCNWDESSFKLPSQTCSEHVWQAQRTSLQGSEKEYHWVEKPTLCIFPANSYPTTKLVPWHSATMYLMINVTPRALQSTLTACERPGPLKTCWMKRVLIAMKLEVMADKQLAAELTLMLEELDEKDPDWIPKQIRKQAKKSE